MAQVRPRVVQNWLPAWTAINGISADMMCSKEYAIDHLKSAIIAREISVRFIDGGEISVNYWRQKGRDQFLSGFDTRGIEINRSDLHKWFKAH